MTVITQLAISGPRFNICMTRTDQNRCNHGDQRDSSKEPIRKFVWGSYISILPKAQKIFSGLKLKRKEWVRKAWADAETCRGRNKDASTGERGGGKTRRHGTLHCTSYTCNTIQKEVAFWKIVCWLTLWYANVALLLARLTVLWERKGSRRWLEYGAGDWLSNPSTCTSSPSTEKPAASLGEEVGLPPSLLLCCAQTIFPSLSKYMVAS